MSTNLTNQITFGVFKNIQLFSIFQNEMYANNMPSIMQDDPSYCQYKKLKKRTSHFSHRFRNILMKCIEMTIHLPQTLFPFF